MAAEDLIDVGMQTRDIDAEPILYVLKADPDLREALGDLLRREGYTVLTAASLPDLIDVLRTDRPGCILTGSKIGDRDATDVLLKLRVDRGLRLPVIVVGTDSRVSDAVACMRHGATDFFEKPFDPQNLLACIRNALSADQLRARAEASAETASRRLNLLTEREREMVQLVASGLSTKQIAMRLHLSQKTVSNHRAHILAKTAARNTAALVQLVVMAKSLDRKSRSLPSPATSTAA